MIVKIKFLLIFFVCASLFSVTFFVSASNAGNVEPVLSGHSLQLSVGDFVRSFSADLLGSTWKFTNQILSGFFQKSYSLLPEAVKSSSASISSFVVQDVKSDFSQLSSQLEPGLAIVMAPIQYIIGRK